MVQIEREDNGKKGRFAIFENKDLAGEMTYTWAGKEKFIIDHTEVGEDFGGKGYGKMLVDAAVEYARENNLKVIPLCPFAKKVFNREESLQDVHYRNTL